MRSINKTIKKVYGNYPEKILQFGEGNFLRAFVDWMVDKANRSGAYQGSIVLCQPIPEGLCDVINRQDGLYTLAMRGSENGKPAENIEVITSVSRCINPYEDYDALLELARREELEVVVSNTTEAGIAYHEGDCLSDRPPVSFPAKITAFLYERYQAFHGDPKKGLLFLPVELIDNNGAELKRLVLRYAKEWGLEDSFLSWVEKANAFASTLVDRIVTGYPREEADAFEKRLGYQDQLLDTCELFNLWVIEGDKKWAERFPVHKTDAHVIWTDDVSPYKKRKVRILNGAHTSTVLAAYLAGYDTVGDFMKDDTIRAFMNKVIYDEVIPTLDLPEEDLKSFARAVNDRFSNPYIKHKLLDIALNSCSKFNARCLPSLLDYADTKGILPECLTFSLAAFIRFYQCEKKDGAFWGIRKDGSPYPVRDDASVLEFMSCVWETKDPDHVAEAVLSRREFWSGRDLTEVGGLKAAVAAYLKEMDQKSIPQIMQRLLENV